MFDLSGRVALVSGGSRGIGRARAEGFAASGAEVIVASRRKDACGEVASAIEQAGGKAIAMQCHAGKLDEIEALFGDITSRFGRLDVLVNCGATNPFFGLIGDTEPSVFDKTIEVNLRGPFFMSAHAVKLMRPRGSGSIINVASINGISPGLFQGIYSITKAALINMTKSFALEYGSDGIRVNALLPGLTDTKLASALTKNPEHLQPFLDKIALHRVAQPEEMVGAAIYLASDAYSYTTGATQVVDGGATI